MLAVRRLAAEDVPAVVLIVQGLRDCFTGDVPVEVERDSRNHGGWVLVDLGA